MKSKNKKQLGSRLIKHQTLDKGKLNNQQSKMTLKQNKTSELNIEEAHEINNKLRGIVSNDLIFEGTRMEKEKVGQLNKLFQSFDNQTKMFHQTQTNNKQYQVSKRLMISTTSSQKKINSLIQPHKNQSSKVESQHEQYQDNQLSQDFCQFDDYISDAKDISPKLVRKSLNHGKKDQSQQKSQSQKVNQILNRDPDNNLQSHNSRNGKEESNDV
ncbi:UNKNOWN [Stylonychia lemnae]|uniref:Uncharacterized protein n=1 Tax=Stylonychia lemnae TaxID=5949 RepID=A0A078A639_STYLE|nr:UNKNOWN [Stylonychia lemnae]|eukprot:CDW76219.1 UNKNOWN [Stylonychia lemnae]